MISVKFMASSRGWVTADQSINWRGNLTPPQSRPSNQPAGRKDCKPCAPRYAGRLGCAKGLRSGCFHPGALIVSYSEMVRRPLYLRAFCKAIFASLLTALLVVPARAVPSDTAVAQHGMVVAETAEASAAGVEILKQGGNAIDAACAAALATGVTHAASCGIGGGGFMLFYLASSGQFYALDYRERAPLQATATMFIRDGHPDESLARSGALAIAVPGEIAGIDAALRRYGTMKFQQVAVPAVRLAQDGFALNPHLAHEIASLQDKL